MPLIERSHRTGDGQARGAEASRDQPARWARVKALFMEALQYSESERTAFVARAAAGDAELQTEVESLLANERAAGSFCEIPAAGLLPTLANAQSTAPL